MTAPPAYSQPPAYSPALYGQPPPHPEGPAAAAALVLDLAAAGARKRNQPDRYGLARWLRDATRPDTKGTRSAELYASYAAWWTAHDAVGPRMAGQVVWGRWLTQAGYPFKARRGIRWRRLAIGPAASCRY